MADPTLDELRHLLGKRRIAILTPVSRTVEPDFTSSLLQTAAACQAARVQVAWLHMRGHANLPRVRNLLAATALAGDVTDLVWIDADIGWDLEGFLRLFRPAQSVHIVGGAAQRRVSGQLSFCGSFDQQSVDVGEGGLIRAKTATSFLRVSRTVFETMRDHHPEWHFWADEVSESARRWVCTYFQYALVEHPARPGEFMYESEDYQFSRHAERLGFASWIDPRIRLRHWNPVAMDANLGDALGGSWAGR